LAEVLVTGSLSLSTIEVGDQVRFWLTARNPSTQSVSEVRLSQLDAPGYQVERLSWCAGQPRWSASQKSVVDLQRISSDSVDLSACAPLKDELKPGQSVTVWGDLRGRTPQELQTIVAVVAWKTADNQESELAVPIGQGVVESRLGRLWHNLRDTLKDFGLPLVLLGLGWYFQRWEQKRAQRKEEEEKRRVHLAETWNLMLPTAHDLMTKYYMPLAGAARRTSDYLARYTNEIDHRASRSTARMAFFYSLFFQRRLREVFYSIGGFHFKSRVGEELAVECLGQYQKLYYGDGEVVQRLHGAAAGRVELLETVDSFFAKLDGSSDIDENITRDLQQSWKYFQAWLRAPQCKEAVIYMKGLTALVQYEMNRPYEYWYGHSEKLLLDGNAENALLSLASEVAKAPERKDFVKEVREYLAASKNTQLPGINRA
jgi:hypothetical protein